MIKKKLKYEAPEAETLVLKTEGIICQSTGNSSINDWENGDDFPSDL